MTIYYRQCKLMKDSSSTTYAWIPECWAKKGRVIYSRTKDKALDGYVVVAVSDMRRPEDEAIERDQDYKHQREASDI